MTNKPEDPKAAILQATIEADIDELIDKLILFHDYSLHNSLLIMFQMPHARRCAGYKTWQKLEHQVRKGENALWVYAPMLVNDRENPGEKVMLFRLVPVFDISQTDGDTISATPELMNGDDPLSPELQTVFSDLCMTLIDDGVDLKIYQTKEEYEADRGIKGSFGYYNRVDKVIAMYTAQPLTLHNFHTLIHEAAHHMAHTATLDIGEQLPKGYNWHETVAELATLKLMAGFGFDCRTFALPYVTIFKAHEQEIAMSLAWADRVLSRLKRDLGIGRRFEQEKEAA